MDTRIGLNEAQGSEDLGSGLRVQRFKGSRKYRIGLKPYSQYQAGRPLEYRIKLELDQSSGRCLLAAVWAGCSRLENSPST